MPVVVLDSVITHTSVWVLDKEIHQLVFFLFRRATAGYLAIKPT